MQCWVRIHGLPQEYWRPKLLFEIAKGIGTSISLDDGTKNRVFGDFARILVNVDLSGRLNDEIMVERNGFAFYVGVEYEKLPYFYSHCQTIGHSLSVCKKKSPMYDRQDKDVKAPKDKHVHVFVPKTKVDSHVTNVDPAMNKEDGVKQHNVQDNYLIHDNVPVDNNAKKISDKDVLQDINTSKL